MAWIKKYRTELVIALIAAILFNIATFFLPHNFRGLSFYGFLFVVDVVVSAIFFSVFKWKGAKRIVFLALYWAPFTLLSLIVLVAIFIPFPDWNAYIKVISATLLFALLVAHVLLYIFVLVIGLIRFFTKNRHVDNTLLIVGMVASVFVFVVCAIAPFYWTASPKTIAVDIFSEQVPKGFDGYTIVQLSDIHTDYYLNDKILQTTTQQIAALNPDIILITGDMVTYKSSEVERFLPVLQKLHAPDGVYNIMGNHDYGTYYRWKTEEEQTQNDIAFSTYMEQLGWTLLRNESDYLVRNGDTIVLAGTENQCLHESHYPCEGDINVALQGIPKQYPVIVMTHDPIYWQKELKDTEHPVFLTLSGHTHGLQIGYRTKKRNWGLYRVINKYWSGLYEENGNYLYINAGLGTVGFPFRIGLNPEITFITLHCK